MKKLIYITIMTILLFTNFTFSLTQNQTVKTIEMSQYYGYVGLLIDLHIEIGKGEVQNQSMFFMIGLINDMKYYSDLDIIEYLSYSLDLTKSFEYLLFDIGDLITQADFVLVDGKKKLDYLKQQRLECDSLKDLADKNFSLALKDLNANIMELSLNNSLEYQNCSSESRINYNSTDKILKELNFYFEILSNKYNYFYNNKFNIIENYDEIYLNKIK